MDSGDPPLRLDRIFILWVRTAEISLTCTVILLQMFVAVINEVSPPVKSL